MWIWYTGCWSVGCYIWYSDEGTGRCRPPRHFLTVPNVTAHPSAASVPIAVLLYNGPLLCRLNVSIWVNPMRLWPAVMGLTQLLLCSGASVRYELRGAGKSHQTHLQRHWSLSTTCWHQLVSRRAANSVELENWRCGEQEDHTASAHEHVGDWQQSDGRRWRVQLPHVCWRCCFHWCTYRKRLVASCVHYAVKMASPSATKQCHNDVTGAITDPEK